jgi:hypothetical protein
VRWSVASISASAVANKSVASLSRAAFTHRAMLCYAVGIYHPGPHRHTDAEPFNLTEVDLANMNLVGYPVTLEHANIDNAAKLLAILSVAETATSIYAALTALSKGSKYHAPIGLIIDNGVAVDGRWYCLFAFDGELTAVKTMIEIGALRGLSLTHRVSQTPSPLEVSLCCQPARPGCYVRCIVGSLDVAQAYMRAAITGAPTMTESTPTNSPFLEIIAGLPEADRDTMNKGIEALVAQVNAATATAKMSESTAVEQKSSNALLTAQIGMMTGMLTDDIRDTYYCSAEQLTADMASGDLPTILGTTERMICAANRQMMEFRAGAARQAPAARSAPIDRKRKMSTDAAAPASSLPDDDLARGIASAVGHTIN